MLKLEFDCENNDEARMYINAPNYYALICDLANNLRTHRKHGSSAGGNTVEDIVNIFYDDLQNCANLEGPY